MKRHPWKGKSSGLAGENMHNQRIIGTSARHGSGLLNEFLKDAMLIVAIDMRTAPRGIKGERMSRKLHFEYEVPDEVFDESFSEAAFLQQIKEDAIIKLFTAGRLASGYAASLLGITRRDFLDLITRQGIPLVEYTETDLAADLQTLHTLESRHQGKPGSPPLDDT
jgi:predicted HTH domain antitoxin